MDAGLQDGPLRQMPEQLKPRRIEIATTAPKADGLIEGDKAAA